MTKVIRWAVTILITVAVPLVTQAADFGLTSSDQDNCDRGQDAQKVKPPCFVRLMTWKVTYPPGPLGDLVAISISTLPKLDPGDLRFVWGTGSQSAQLSGLRVVILSSSGKELYSGRMPPAAVAEMNQRRGTAVFALTKEGASAVRKLLQTKNELALIPEYKGNGDRGNFVVTRKVPANR